MLIKDYNSYSNRRKIIKRVLGNKTKVGETKTLESPIAHKSLSKC